MSGDDIECIAWDLIARFGDLAAPIACELASASDEAQHEMLLSAEAWRDIINAIRWLSLKP
jgi:hypothetical protein